MALVDVSSYYRNGKKVLGYSRHQETSRGGFSNVKKSNRYKTMWTKDLGGLFIGRKSVSGVGDRTGIFRESKGRIIGRQKA